MKTTFKTIATLALCTVLMPGMGSVDGAQAQITGADLLRGIAGVAENLARRDAQRGRSADAANWAAWANLYRTGAALLPPQMSAQQMLRGNIEFCRQMMAKAALQGQRPLTNFYRASVVMWQDLLNQVERGGEVIVHFPDEMLIPIPGAPGTPWERMSISVPAQPPVVTAPPAVSSPTFGGDAQSLINRLNSMSQADVNRLMGRGHWLDAFKPWWWDRTGGNPLAQFGIGKGLMGTLGTRDLNRIFDQRELDRIAPQLRQAQIMGNLAGGIAAQNRVYNEVGKYENYRLADKAAFEALLRLWAQVQRTGVNP